MAKARKVREVIGRMIIAGGVKGAGSRSELMEPL